MRRITSRFVLLIATAAVAAADRLRRRLDQLAAQRHEQFRHGRQPEASPTQVAEQVNDVHAEQHAGASVGRSRVRRDRRSTPWQQDRILKDYVLDFPEFREITLFDRGRPARWRPAGSERATVAVPKQVGSQPDRASTSRPFKVDDDLLPTTTIAVRLADGPAGDRLDRRRVLARRALADGRPASTSAPQGYALIVGERRAADRARQPGRKAPHRRRTESNAASEELKFAAAHPQDSDADISRVLQRQRRRRCWRSAAPDDRSELDGRRRTADGRSVRGTRTARTAARRRHRPGAARHAGARLSLGPLLHPAHLRADARHALDRRRQARRRASRSRGHDEIRELGDAFNSMADRLVELQEDIRKQERQVMFGRIAAGLVHDLSHPIQNIGNSCKLIVEDVGRRRVPRDVPPDGRARDGSWSSACSTTCATSPSRFRSSASRSTSTARSARRSNRCSSTPRPPASRSGAELVARGARSSKATCSRSAASIAT